LSDDLESKQSIYGTTRTLTFALTLIHSFIELKKTCTFASATSRTWKLRFFSL